MLTTHGYCACLYANVTEFGIRDVATSGILTLSPLNCVPSRTYNAGRPHVGLCPKFLVLDLLSYCVCYYFTCAYLDFKFFLTQIR